MDDAAVVVVGHDQIELHLRAVIGLFERDVRRNLVILAAQRMPLPARSRTCTRTSKRIEQIGEIEIVE